MRHLLLSLILGAFVITPMMAQENNNKFLQEVLLPLTNQEALLKLAEESRKLHEQERNEAIKKANELGIPIEIDLEDGGKAYLIRFDETGTPIYYGNQNTNAAISTRADRVHSGGGAGLSLSGNGITIGEWDGGAARSTHEQYSGRVTIMDGSSNSDHATHVCGTMIGDGTGNASAMGMAPQASVNSYDFFSDDPEMSTEAAGGLIISNHSYGSISGWRFSGGWHWHGDTSQSQVESHLFGLYNSSAVSWDNIAFNAPYYLIVKSAGNDRNDGGPAPGTAHTVNGVGSTTQVRAGDCNSGTGYDCVSTNGTAKNILTVAAVDDVTPYTGAGSVVMSSFSGWGPTDDGRIKPDISGNGVSLQSSGSSADNDYYNSSGTSMSAPNVTGSCALLQEHYNTTHSAFMLAATLKALVIHTADEAGAAAGPDYEFGWGLMDTEHAAEVISDDLTIQQHITENTLYDGITFTKSVWADGLTPLVATIVWTDPAGTATNTLDDPTLKLVNDLDMRITDGVTTWMPYVLDPANPSNAATTADNFRDNVEKIYIGTPAAGEYTITVTHKGSLTNNLQNFSMIVTGIDNSLVADFTSGAQTGGSPCSPLSVDFEDISTGNPTSWSWTFNGGTPASSSMQNPIGVNFGPGTHDVSLTVNSGAESVTKTGYIVVPSGESLPFTEDFSTFPPTGWTIDNPDGFTTWSSATTGTCTHGQHAFLDNYNYNGVGQDDNLVTPVLDLTGLSSAQLDFDVAYGPWGASNADTLRIEISTDCGSTYTAEVYNKASTTLGTNTGGGFVGNPLWVPADCSEWRAENIDLTPYVGNNITIRFINGNDFGNSLYLDNVSVTGSAATCNISAITAGTQTACVPATNQYTQEVTVTYANDPGSGMLEVNGQQFAITSSPQLVTLTGLTADGAGVNVTARFTADTACNRTENGLFTAPASCLPCNVSMVTAGTQTACVPATNEFTQQVTVTYANDPGSGNLVVNGQSFGITSSPQTVTLTGLDSDGSVVDVTAYFSDDAGQLDQFQGGTTMGWVHGGGSPTPPSVSNDVGPTGTGDHSLLNVSNGGGGPGSRFVARNLAQWTGDFTSNGWTKITMDVNNTSGTPLSLRIGVTGAGGRFVSTTPLSVPANSGWMTLEFPIEAADLSAAGGSNVTTTLSGVSEMRIIHNSSAAWQGQSVAASCLFDNIAAGGCRAVADDLFTAPAACPPCNISDLTAGTQTACVPATNQYTQQVTVTYANQPGSGMLEINGQLFAITSSPQTETLTGLSADGMAVNVTARFTADTACNRTENGLFTAPAPCLPCDISDLTAGTQTACVPATNQYTQEVTVTYANEPGSGMLEVNGQQFAITSSPQTVTLTALTADGAAVNITARFTADTACNRTENGLFTAPANCTPVCNISGITAGSQSPCVPATNQYTQDVTVTYANEPGSGMLEINGQLFAITGSPQTENLSSLTADGAAVNVTARFTADTACNRTETALFTAPAACTPCDISDLTAGTQTACVPGTNQYTQEVTVTYSDEPGSGMLEVNGQQFAITSSPQTVTLTALTADGAAVNVTARFTADTACNRTENALFTAPASCAPVCDISGITAGTQTACVPGTNQYTQQVTVTYTNDPGSGMLDINGQLFAITTSPQTETLTGLTANGMAVNVTASFTADGACTHTENALFTAPASCAVPPAISNDILCNAIVIPTSQFGFRQSSITCNNVLGSNVGATGTGDPASTTCGAFGNTSVWYQFDAPTCTDLSLSAFDITLSTDNPGTNFNTILRVYESSDNTCSGTMMEVACALDGTANGCVGGGAIGNSNIDVVATLQPGNTYFVMVDGEGGATGTFELSVAIIPDTPMLSAGVNPETEVQVDWTDVNATFDHLFWSPVGISGFNVAWNRPTNTQLITHLNDGTDYEFWLGHSCDGTVDDFQWTPTAQISTAASACAAPNPLSCGTTTSNSIQFSWTLNSVATSYHIFYRPVGSGGYGVKWNVPGNTYTLNYLQPNTSYEIWVYSVCPGPIAKPSASLFCATMAAGSKPEVPYETDVYTFDHNGIGYVDFPISEIPMEVLFTGYDETNILIEDGSLVQYDIDGNIIEGNKVVSRQIENNVELRVYPNPVESGSALNVELDLPLNGEAYLIDARGQQIASQLVVDGKSTFDIKSLAAGAYLVRVVTDDNTLTQSVIVE